MSFLTLSLRLA